MLEKSTVSVLVVSLNFIIMVETNFVYAVNNLIESVII